MTSLYRQNHQKNGLTVIEIPDNQHNSAYI
jgi:hypothetical protein